MKKNKVEKLKKIHIWPTIVTILMFIVLMGVSLIFSFVLMLENVINSKITQGYRDTSHIYEVFKEANGNYESTGTEVANIESIIHDISDICVREGDAYIYSNTENMPSIGEAIQHDGINDVLLYLDESELAAAKLSPISVDRHGDIKIDGRALVKAATNNSPDNENENPYVLGDTKTVAKQGVWFYYTLNETQELFVKYNINIYKSDVLINFTIITGIGILGFLLCIIILFNTIHNIKSQRRVAKMYYMDLETGSANFKYFLDTSARLIKRGLRRRKKYAVVHFQMHKFRNYASCYGEEEAKRLLCDFDRLFNQNKKRKEVYARVEKANYGFLMNYNTKEELQERIENIMSSLQQVRSGQRLIFFAGIYYVDDKNVSVEKMYNMAATARASITDDNRMGIACFTEEMLDNLIWERKVINDLDEALQNHDFKVFLQPKYSTDNEELAAAEALVRWIHKTEGFVPPNRFIPILEANGSITKLDDYMISEVAKLQANWIAEGKKIVPISVNVSRVHFMQEDLAEHICQLVDAYHVPHEFIELELTESAFFDDKKTLIKIVNRMKELGFAISMDDFGAGYSSLNSLKELPVDVVKLDEEFFRGNDEAGKGKVIIREAIALAKKLNMKIVAEGIETKEQVDFLVNENCDLIQGYYYAKPMPVVEFEEKAFGQSGK